MNPKQQVYYVHTGEDACMSVVHLRDVPVFLEVSPWA